MTRGRSTWAKRAGLWAALTLGLVAMWPLEALAAAGEMACSPGNEPPVVIRSVNDDLSLTLEDGRVMRLLGVEPVEHAGEHADAAHEARAKLSSWLQGQPARLVLSGDAADRWNRWPALVFVAVPGDGASTPLSVSFALVDAGLARARPEAEAHACWASLRVAENGARVARLGLWADPYYAMRQADDGASLAKLAGTFVVAEGRVAHVGETRGSVFFDLGPRHRALAIRMSKRVLFRLDQGGLGQSAWIGQRIRLRGIVDDRDGPVMDVSDPDQIEVMREGVGDASP